MKHLPARILLALILLGMAPHALLWPKWTWHQMARLFNGEENGE